MVCFKQSEIVQCIINVFTNEEVIAGLWWINSSVLYRLLSQINSRPCAAPSRPVARGILNIEL